MHAFRSQSTLRQSDRILRGPFRDSLPAPGVALAEEVAQRKQTCLQRCTRNARFPFAIDSSAIRSDPSRAISRFTSGAWCCASRRSSAKETDLSPTLHSQCTLSVRNRLFGNQIGSFEGHFEIHFRRLVLR